MVPPTIFTSDCPEMIVIAQNVCCKLSSSQCQNFHIANHIYRHTLLINIWAGTRVSLDTKDSVNSAVQEKQVEDEIHFLFNCSKYEPDRKELVDIILTSCPNFNSLNDK
jgi:hypothetical protein